MGIAYIISGNKWTILVFVLGMVMWLKILTSFLEIQRGEAVKNNNYNSLYVLFKSFNKFLISLYKSFSKMLLYVIIYLLITIILFLVRIEYFYLWAFIFILIYGVKFCNVYYELKLLDKTPLYSTVEYLSGGTEQSLILYETTNTDYRFKHTISGDELIIPITSIKKMYYDYDSELDDVERVLNFEVIKGGVLTDFIVKLIENLFTPLRPILFYRKAVIYSKKKNFEKAENCLSEAIKLEDKFREIAEGDNNLVNIRNENWFIDLIDNQGKNV